MRRITISLPEDLAAALEREAARRRAPVSQVAREAIEASLGLAGDGPRVLPFFGIGESMDGRSAAQSDEYLATHWAPDLTADTASSSGPDDARVRRR